MRAAVRTRSASSRSAFASARILSDSASAFAIAPAIWARREPTVPVGTARKRFNVRFYVLAMAFLVFDVEIIFLYPWAVTYTKLPPQSPEAALFLGRILFFVGTSVITYIYAWKKGVFRWD